MKIAFTDIGTLGYKIDVTGLRAIGSLWMYDSLSDEKIEEALLNDVPDVEVIVTNANRLSCKNLKSLSNLKLICAAATGYNNIDLDYCRKAGIAVTNVPGYAGNSVAQFTFAMLFYIQSHCRFYDDYVKTGRYSSNDDVGYREYEYYELEGKTWGIIGLGDIGRRVACYAGAFGCRIIWYSATGKTNSDEYLQVSLEKLLSESDIISIHAPLNEFTRNLIAIEELKKMKTTAILLNLGRGGIVNEADLAKALDEKIILAAGLDVLEEEPPDLANPLFHLEEPNRLFITPHIAYGSIEARQRLMKGVCDSIRAFINGERFNRVD